MCYSLWYNAPTMLPAGLYYLYQLCTVKQISDNEIYLLIKYTLWRVAKCLSYIEEARCLKVNPTFHASFIIFPHCPLSYFLPIYYEFPLLYFLP